MFKLSQSEAYFWPVVVEFPVDGRTDKQDFSGKFKRLKQSRLKEIADQIQAGKITDSELVREILVGWKDIKGEDGQDLPFTSDALDRLLDVPLVSQAIVTAFFNSVTGAKIKN